MPDDKEKKTIVVIPAYEPPKEFFEYAKSVSAFVAVLFWLMTVAL